VLHTIINKVVGNGYLREIRKSLDIKVANFTFILYYSQNPLCGNYRYASLNDWVHFEKCIVRRFCCRV